MSSQSDDELELPYLEGFEWAGDRPPGYLTKEEDIEKYKNEEWPVLHIRLQSTPSVSTRAAARRRRTRTRMPRHR